MFKARIIYSCLNQEPQDRAYTLESTNFVIFNSKFKCKSIICI